MCFTQNLSCARFLKCLVFEGRSPVHTFCEGECEVNFDVTWLRSQRMFRSSWRQFNYSLRICDVKTRIAFAGSMNRVSVSNKITMPSAVKTLFLVLLILFYSMGSQCIFNSQTTKGIISDFPSCRRSSYSSRSLKGFRIFPVSEKSNRCKGWLSHKTVTKAQIPRTVIPYSPWRFVISFRLKSVVNLSSYA